MQFCHNNHHRYSNGIYEELLSMLFEQPVKQIDFLKQEINDNVHSFSTCLTIEVYLYKFWVPCQKENMGFLFQGTFHRIYPILFHLDFHNTFRHFVEPIITLNISTKAFLFIQYNMYILTIIGKNIFVPLFMIISVPGIL